MHGTCRSTILSFLRLASRSRRLISPAEFPFMQPMGVGIALTILAEAELNGVSSRRLAMNEHRVTPQLCSSAEERTLIIEKNMNQTTRLFSLRVCLAVFGNTR